MTRIAAERPPIRMLGVSRWGDEVRISREMFFCGMGGFFVRSPGLASLTARPPERGRVGVPNEMRSTKDAYIDSGVETPSPEKMEVLSSRPLARRAHTPPCRGADGRGPIRPPVRHLWFLSPTLSGQHPSEHPEPE